MVQEEVDGNATAFNEKCLAALILCATLWAAQRAAFGRNPSDVLSPRGGGGFEEHEDGFLPCKHGLQVEVPLLAVLSTDEAFASNKDVKSDIEKSSHLKSCSFSKLLSERQHTVCLSI